MNLRERFKPSAPRTYKTAPVEFCGYTGVAPHATGIYPGLRLPSDLAKLDALLRRDSKSTKWACCWLGS